jgi:hypothetical protein
LQTILRTAPRRFDGYPAVRALAVKLWLDGNVTYSRKPKSAGGDPVGSFLFGDRRGYCVHFAHAACLLYRAAGVPARVATGYMAPAKRRGAGSALLIQGSDAHAWPEIYIEGKGWMPLDIEPGSTDEPAPAEPDHSLQQFLGEAARKAHRPLPGEKRDDIQQRATAGVHALSGALGWALAALAIAGYGVKLYRYWAPVWCGGARLPVVAYRWTLDRLAETGHTRAFGQSREQFAMACGGAAMRRLTQRHLAATLGKRPTALGRTEWIALCSLAAREGTAGSSRTRRLLGYLNPLSWRWAR